MGKWCGRGLVCRWLFGCTQNLIPYYLLLALCYSGYATGFVLPSQNYSAFDWRAEVQKVVLFVFANPCVIVNGRSIHTCGESRNYYHKYIDRPFAPLLLIPKGKPIS